MVEKHGDRIRQFRKAQGMTLEEFGEKIDFSTGYLSNVERNAVGPSSNLLIKLHEVFNLSSDYILFGIEKPPLQTGTNLRETIQQPPQLSGPCLADTVKVIMETNDFLLFPVQTFNSTTQLSGSLLKEVVIHKRVLGRRKNLAAVHLDEGKKVVIVGR